VGDLRLGILAVAPENVWLSGGRMGARKGLWSGTPKPGNNDGARTVSFRVLWVPGILESCWNLAGRVFTNITMLS
jgi:hypothetical protein